MRAISGALISFVCFYMARYITPPTDEGRAVNGFLAFLSWIFLFVSIVFMILGM